MQSFSLYTELHYDQVHSRVQVNCADIEVNVEALYVPELTAKTGARLPTPWLDQPLVDSAGAEITYCALLMGWLQVQAHETLVRLRGAFRAAGVEPSPGIYILDACPRTYLDKRRFELALALAMLGAARQVSLEPLRGCEVFGAVNADGTINLPGDSLVSDLCRTHLAGRCALVPKGRELEAHIAGVPFATVTHFSDLVQLLKNGEAPPFQVSTQSPALPAPRVPPIDPQHTLQMQALLIAAAGGHRLELKEDD
jgi:magnesium chelatase family protein